MRRPEDCLPELRAGTCQRDPAGSTPQVVRPIDSIELERLRRLVALEVLHVLAEHTKLDRDFVPTHASGTCRVHVSANGTDWELLINGSRFFDTRASKGGGGAVDLVMHLWQAPFKKAVKMLREAGA